MAKKRGPKRNRHQKARDQQKAAELREQGATLRQIGAQLDLDEKQIRLDLAEIDQSLLRQAEETVTRTKVYQLAKLQHAQIQAQEAWKRSLEDAGKTTIKRFCLEDQDDEDGELQPGETVTKEKKGQSGNPGHLKNYIKAVEMESRLLGLLDKDEGGKGNSQETTDALKQLSQVIAQAHQDYGAE